MRKVYVFVDGSFKPAEHSKRGKASGVGYVFNSKDRKSIEGSIPAKSFDSVNAELLAIFYGLKHAIEHHGKKGEFIVHTDCEHIINFIIQTHRKYNSSKKRIVERNEIVQNIRQLKQGVQCEFRHVKGHVPMEHRAITHELQHTAHKLAYKQVKNQ